MGYAEDTSRLCLEINQMRGARMEMRGRLHQFAAELRRNINEQRSAMRRHNAEEAARTKTMLASFVANLRQTMRQAMGSFAHERMAAHSAWMRMPGARRR
jgi:hypothetical protein